MYAALQADCSNILSSIKYLTHDELVEILNNDEKIELLLNSCDQDNNYIKNLESEKDVFISSNKCQAESNLAREPELIEGREALEKVNRLGEEIAARIQQKHDEIKSKNGDMTLETALVLLQTGASELEGESDSIASKFLDNEMELEEFLEKFVSIRKQMHMRNVKADKLSKLIEGGNPYGSSNYSNVPPMNINRSYFPGMPNVPVPNNAVPYPMGPINMPLPGSNYFQGF